MNRGCIFEAAARHANEIRLKAEYRLGGMLSKQIRPGGSPEALSLGVTKLPAGVTRNQSHQWQRIAKLPEPVFEAALQEPEPTTAGLLEKILPHGGGSPQLSPSTTIGKLRDFGITRNQSSRRGEAGARAAGPRSGRWPRRRPTPVPPS